MSEQKISIRPNNNVADQKPAYIYPTEIISLPTDGYFYPEGHPLSTGEVELKYMTAKEEDILSSENLIRKGKVIDALLESLIVNKNIKTSDLFIIDKEALVISARKLAYGDKYSTVINCPSCGQKNEIDINLSEFQPEPFDFSQYERGINIFNYTTPKGGNIIQYKLLTQKDELEIDVTLKALAKMNKNSVVPEITIRLKQVIVSVDGDDSKSRINEFVDRILSQDSLAFRQHMRANIPKLNTKFLFDCQFCSYEKQEDTPIGVNFLYPELGT